MDVNRANDRDILLNFYQLKTLKPQSYANDTYVSFLDKDYTDSPANVIPKPIINKLLSENNSAAQQTQRKTMRTQDRSSTDFRDALGFSENIKELLLDMDVIEDTRDPQLHKFMVDSKSFNPKVFLSTIHAEKSLNELKKGIDYLERDIEAKKPELQQLITSNFEKTLSTKNSLDTVFIEYGNSQLNSKIDQLEVELASSSNSANQLLNPVLLQIAKENQIADALKQIEHNREFLDLPKKIKEHIDQDNFDSILEEYKIGQSLFVELRSKYPKNPLYPRVWSKIEELINNYKNSMFDLLNSIHLEIISSNFQNPINPRGTNFVTIIKRLILLGSDKSPIKEFIHTQYSRVALDLEKGLTNLKYDRLINTRTGIINAYELDQSAEDPLGQTEKLANTTMNKLYNIMSKPNFKPEQIDNLYKTLDLPLVVELWEFIFQYVDDVVNSVINKKILKFENIYKFFMNDFPDTLDARTRKDNIGILAITDDDKFEMKTFFRNVINKICGRLEFVFTCTSKDMDQALGLAQVYEKDAVFPPVSAKVYEETDSFGFIPPHSNSISTVCYIVELHKKIYDALMLLQNNKHIFHSEKLDKALISATEGVNKNMLLGALCFFNEDMKSIPLMENWEPSDANEGATKFSEFLFSYYQIFLAKIRQLHVSEDPKVMESVISLFIISLSTVIESYVTYVSERCQYDQDKSDFYHLSAIANLKFIRKVTIPKILKMFDTSFDQSLHLSNNLDVYAELINHEKTLLNDCINPYLATIKDIVREGIVSIPDNTRDISSKIETGNFVNVSGYVMRVFGYINSVKSKLVKWNASKPQILEIEIKLLNQFLKKVYDSLTTKFDKDSAVQIAVDLSMVKIVIDKFNSIYSNAIDTKKLEAAAKTFSSGIDASILQNNLSKSVKINTVLIKCVLET